MIDFTRRWRWAACLLPVGAAAAAQPSAAPAPAPARWHLDGSTDRCVLTRRLEGTPAPATFILRTIPASGRYDLILAGRDLPSEMKRGDREAALALLPARSRYEGPTRSVDLPADLGRGLAVGPFPSSFAREFAGATRLRLATPGGAELGSWAIPGAARAAEALAMCEAEKQIEWGADPGSVEAGATPPRAPEDASSWLTPRDLGIVNPLGSVAFAAVFRLVVGEDGRAVSCTLVESAGNVELHRDVCRTLVKRAKYQPGRDAAGKAVKAAAIHIVSLRMETEFRLIEG